MHADVDAAFCEAFEQKCAIFAAFVVAEGKDHDVHMQLADMDENVLRGL